MPRDGKFMLIFVRIYISIHRRKSMFETVGCHFVFVFILVLTINGTSCETLVSFASML